ncbi:hypothetical protein TWF281_007907 [Arthrobotrys megalospora]
MLSPPSPSCVPLDVQYLILEAADWTEHPTLSQVCHAWRKFLQISNVALDKRYDPPHAIHELLPTIRSDQAQLQIPRLHRALSERYITLSSSYRFRFCHQVQLRADLSKHRGNMDGETIGTNVSFFSNDPAVRFSQGPGGRVDIATRTADSWFRQNFGEPYPMACDTAGTIPTIGFLFNGALTIARNGYTGDDYVVFLAKCWVQSFFDPVILGLSWQARYISQISPGYLDLTFRLEEVGTGRVEGTAAALLRKLSVFVIPRGELLLRKLLMWWANYTSFTPNLRRRVLTPGNILWLPLACGVLLLFFFLYHFVRMIAPLSTPMVSKSQIFDSILVYILSSTLVYI